jgi:hypothetical protein
MSSLPLFDCEEHPAKHRAAHGASAEQPSSWQKHRANRTSGSQLKAAAARQCSTRVHKRGFLICCKRWGRNSGEHRGGTRTPGRPRGPGNHALLRGRQLLQGRLALLQGAAQAAGMHGKRLACSCTSASWRHPTPPCLAPGSVHHTHAWLRPMATRCARVRSEAQHASRLLAARAAPCSRALGHLPGACVQHVAACCSMVQHVAACCSMLQHVAACCSMLPQV